MARLLAEIPARNPDLDGIKNFEGLSVEPQIQNWNQIGAFATILALRTMVKLVMTWEERHLL